MAKHVTQLKTKICFKNFIKNITELTNISEADAISELVKSNPQKRLIKPIEIAEVVSWLCGKHSDSINGQNIPVSGGEI